MDATVKLPMEKWDAIIDILGDGSVKKAFPLIQAILEQTRAQAQAAQQTNNAKPSEPE